VSAPAYLSRGTVRKPARLAIVAVLLLWAGPAMTEEGPKASAPLPPPLPAAPAEAPSPPMDVKPSGQPAPEKADPPEKEFDKPKTGSPQVNSLAAPNVTRAVRKKDNRSLKEHAGTQAAPPVRRSALIPDERRRNPAPALHQPGRLSPPPDPYPVPRTANTAPANAEPPPMPPPYSPGYPGGAPAIGYGNYYPYRWPSANSAPFRPGY
jgi:hypothetical protein